MSDTLDRAAKPQEIRKRLDLTQEGFAALLGVSLRTLQDWEQGRHKPTGPARTLLLIADRHPDILAEAWQKEG
jgi:putative transcriptional regulator